MGEPAGLPSWDARGGWRGQVAGPQGAEGGRERGRGEGRPRLGRAKGTSPRERGVWGFPYFLFSSKFLRNEYLTKAKQIHTKEKMRGSA
jgi:hypothetical protein